MPETIEAINACKAKNVKLMTALQRRFDPNFARVRQAIKDGEVGEPLVIKLCSRDPAPPPFDLDNATASASHSGPASPTEPIRPPAVTDQDAAAEPLQATSFPRFLCGQLGLTSEEEVGGQSSRDTDAQREGVYNFLQVPWNIEPFLIFG